MRKTWHVVVKFLKIWPFVVWSLVDPNCAFVVASLRGGRGPRSNNVLDFIIEHSNDSQDSWGSQDDSIRVSWWATPPLRPPHVHQTSSRDRCSQPFPVFRALPLPCTCIILNANRRTKKRGRPGNEATFVVVDSYKPHSQAIIPNDPEWAKILTCTCTIWMLFPHRPISRSGSSQETNKVLFSRL